MDRTLVKSDHTFETKRIDHLKKSSATSFQFSIQLPLLRSIYCAKLFLQSSNVFFKVNGTDVEQLHNIVFYF